MLTWAHHYGTGTGTGTGSADADANGSADAAVASVATAPLKKPHLLRHLVSTQIRSGWPRKQLLGTRPDHSEQLLRILHYVSKRTSGSPPPFSAPLIGPRRVSPTHTAFTKSGDLVIHATLYANLPAERIATLSLYELPYELAGHQYGVKANQKARQRSCSRHGVPTSAGVLSQPPAAARRSGASLKPTQSSGSRASTGRRQRTRGPWPLRHVSSPKHTVVHTAPRVPGTP